MEDLENEVGEHTIGDMDMHDPAAEHTPAAEGAVADPVETADPEMEKKAAEVAEAEALAAAEKGEPGEKAGAEAYKPNFKYKVMDKEFEIPKQFQALMKDEASSKLVRELHEKAGGLETVKTKLNDTRTERDRFSQEANTMKSSIDGLRAVYQDAVKTGNLLKLDQFFERLKIPEQVVMQYAIAKAKFAELPDNQRQIISSQMQHEQRASELAQQNQQHQATVAQMAYQTKMAQMDMALARADIHPVASAFDTRMNKPGAFKEAVRKHGEYAFYQGKDLSPDQAALEVIQMYGLQAAPASSTATPGASASDASGKKVVQRTTNTIPNVQGRSGASPLKGKPKSIEDLKKLYNEMT